MNPTTFEPAIDMSNLPPGQKQPTTVPAVGRPDPDAASLDPKVLDTRPLFERGETPCHAIEEALASLAPGQPLVLLVPFEPVPLYAKFSRAGFSHQSQRLPNGTWRIQFTAATTLTVV